jgi:hypothetical protein
MKMTKKNGYWFVEFLDCKCYKQETMHTSLNTAMQMAFINKTTGF